MVKMRTDFPGGVWPTMITPFTAENRIDFDVLAPMADWYVREKVDGLFAVCQSSAMFDMTLDERVSLAEASLDAVAGRVPVIASGHISENVPDQIRETNRIIETGVEAFVFVTNRFARQSESDETWFENLERILRETPEEVPLGLYECPYPYKRELTPELIARVAATGRFCFLKDTCCSVELITAKIEAARDTPLRVYNANAATLLASLRAGAAGYSGVMANFHPDLYCWLCQNWRTDSAFVHRIQAFLTMASVYEYQLYPVNAKYYQQLEGIPIELYCRRADCTAFTESQRLEVEHMHDLAREFTRELSL
ncbi:MAG: dihydrodipicolinate synthase family protein [Spirochaetaceae bacterium]|nr:MAG: dihydrodipicolinate synthase family protein [Spirochaetaceae bacterium]